MGDPKRLRKKFEKSKLMWNKERIEKEHGLVDRYGLKNLRELWRVTTEVSRVRRNVREVLSGRSEEIVGKNIIARLAKYNIVNRTATLDDMLGITAESMLGRRLQTLVFKKGFAKTIRQSRQLITHGFVSIDGRRVTSPGYLVTANEESRVGYYKPISLEVKPPVEKPQEDSGKEVTEGTGE